MCVAYLAGPLRHAHADNQLPCIMALAFTYLLRLVLLQGRPWLKPAQLPFYMHKGGRT